MFEREFQGLVTLKQLPQRGMITVRGDLGSSAMKKAVSAVPERGMCAGDVAWMSPDELLVMCPHGDVRARVDQLRADLAGTHHLVQDVSDARVIYSLEGAAAREVIAKLCPVDMAAMEKGRFRRTRLAQVPCAFWMREVDAIELVVFTSVADYAWHVLVNAADPAAPVGHFTA
ncbi:MAG: sarcosine oxidase subunit gamma family protein [Pseudomonadota bacterium]